MALREFLNRCIGGKQEERLSISAAKRAGDRAFVGDRDRIRHIAAGFDSDKLSGCERTHPYRPVGVQADSIGCLLGELSKHFSMRQGSVPIYVKGA